MSAEMSAEMFAMAGAIGQCSARAEGRRKHQRRKHQP
jgi:hypothetical protein